MVPVHAKNRKEAPHEPVERGRPPHPIPLPQGEREKTGQNLHRQVQRFNARILRGILSPIGGEKVRAQSCAGEQARVRTC